MSVEHVYSDLVVLLGAGASKDAGLPIVRDLSDHGYLTMLKTSFESIVSGTWGEKLFKVCETIRSSGLPFEELIADAYNLEDQTLYAELIDYYQTLLTAAETYGGAISPKPGERVAADYYRKLIAILATYPGGSTVLSFNHDLWIEHSAFWQDFRYGSIINKMIDNENIKKLKQPLDNHDAPITLLKLHGSFNYINCTQCDLMVVGQDNIWQTVPLMEKCPKCEAALEPYYAPPLKNKSINKLETIWYDARHALQAARYIIIIGYSMPPYDGMARALLEDNLNPNAQIYIIDKYANEVTKNYAFLEPREVILMPFTARDAIERWFSNPQTLFGDQEV